MTRVVLAGLLACWCLTGAVAQNLGFIDPTNWQDVPEKESPQDATPSLSDAAPPAEEEFDLGESPLPPGEEGGIAGTPINDLCINAIAVGPGVTAGDTLLATSDGPAGCGNNNVWYRYTPGAAGPVTISFCAADGGAADYDTIVGVYTGCCGALTLVVCNDDSCGLQSSVTFAATAGTTYFISVGGFSTATGTFAMALIGPAVGCVPDFVVSGAGAYPGNTTAAADDCPGAFGPDHVYQVCIPSAGNWTFSTCTGTAFDTVLFLGTSCCDGSLAVNDDSCGLQSSITANLTPGIYFVTVEGFGGAAGAYTLTITAPPPPAPLPGETCALATPIGPGLYPGSNVGSTTDGPAGCGAIGSDVWYRYTPGSDGTVTATFCTGGGAASYDTVLAAYTGCCGSLTEVICNDDTCGLRSEISFAATAGTTYYIRVGGFNGAQGTYTLNLTGPAVGCVPDFVVNGAGAYPGSTAGAADDCTLRVGPDHVYQVCVPFAGNWTFETCGSAFDTVIYLGAACCSGSIATNDDACSLQSRITANLTPGIYYLTIEGFGGASGAYTLTITAPPPPAVNDTCATATPLAVPSVTPGTNAGATADQDIYACNGIAVLTVGGVPAEKGVWYTITGTGNTITATTCSGVATDLNTLIRVFCGSCAQLTCITANNTASPACVPSTAARVSFCSVAGQTYYIFVANGVASGTTEGPFTLTITDDGIPCSTGVICQTCTLSPPGGSIPEQDACGAETNGGCNSTPPAFQNILCGDTVAGTARTFLNVTTASRDTDWYRFTLPGPALVSWTATAEFPLGAFLIDLTGAGDTCPGTTIAAAFANPCATATASLLLPGGTHVAFVSLATPGGGVFTGFPCGTNNDYFATLTCTPAGACCLIDGSCRTALPGDCAALGGTYQGDFTSCTPNPCPPAGACCLPDTSCLTLIATECANRGGIYQGDGVPCGTIYPFALGGLLLEDISGTGTQITTSTPGFTGSLDDGGAPIAIGFDFVYFGGLRQTINVYTNGYLNFGAIVNDFSNDPSFPNPATPNDMIAPYWDDLDLRTQGTLHVQTLGAPGSRRFIAQWTNVPRFGATGSSNTFQAILYEGDNCIEFRYGPIETHGPASRTVGLENSTGTVGTNIDPTAVAAGVSVELCPLSTLCIPGACILCNGTCQQLIASQCAALPGSTFLGPGTPCPSPLTLVVDDDGQASAADCDAACTTFATIQAAVNAANPGDTIRVCPGTYEEQVVIDKSNLHIVGSGAAVTTIRSPVSLSYFFTTGPNNNYPIVGVHDCTGVTLEDLTIDGAGRGNGNYRFQGVAWFNADGGMDDCVVRGIRETPFSGTQHGVAVYCNNSGGGPYNLSVTDCRIEDYQKNGFVLAGDGLAFTVDNCDVLGVGATAIIAQNGIQASFGPSGTISRCDVSGHMYTPLTFVSCGLLLFDAGTVDVNGCTLSDNNVGAYYIDTDGTFAANHVNNAAATALYGVALDDSAAALTGGNRVPPIELFDGAALPGEDGPGGGNTVDIVDCALLGHDEPNSYGVTAYAAGGASLTLNVATSQLRDWDYGVDTFESGGTIVATVNYNQIVSNATLGFSSNSAAPQNAEYNFWGDCTGPLDALGTDEADSPPCFDPATMSNTNGLGNGVSDLTVDYCPWLCNPASIALNSDAPCYQVGETITVSIDMLGSTAIVVGGQYFLTYDATKLAFVAATTGDPPFTREVYRCTPFSAPTIVCTPTVGLIDYAVGVPNGVPGTSADTTMARLTFTALAEVCDVAGLVDFRPHVPPTRLSDEFGGSVDPAQIALNAISIDSTVPAVSCSATDAVIDDDCEATVTFSATVTDSCSIFAADVLAGAVLTTGNATLGVPSFIYTQIDAQTVGVTGSVTVSDLTGCPATVAWTINATDCAGNPAAACNAQSNVTDETDPVLTCPPDVSVLADAGSCSASAATVNGGVATATDNCDTNVTVVGVRSDSLPLGDPYPTGVTTITWTATDDCLNSTSCVQTITVAAVSNLTVEVALDGVVDPGPFTRCITFEFWNCAPPNTAPDATVDAVMTFTGGTTGLVNLNVPCGAWSCVTARDRRHTLRRTIDPLPISGTSFSASFTGPKALLGGNLNDDYFIDILDFGIFSFQFAVNYGSVDTTCATPAPHADVNGDGVVFTPDFTFIQTNFLRSHEPNCCGAANIIGPAGNDRPLESITVEELEKYGLAHLAIADLNADGVLDAADITAFLDGSVPRPPRPVPGPADEAGLEP
jgi:hypothetical protein